MGLRFYGNWCGWRYGSGEPVDKLDCACRDHDLCYKSLGRNNCKCDEELAKKAQLLKDDSELSRKARRKARWIWVWFGFKSC